MADWNPGTTSSQQDLPYLLRTNEAVAVEIKGQPAASIMEAGRATAGLLNRALSKWHSIFYLLLSRAQINQLELAEIGYNQLGWIMTESIEATRGITTGISAADRAQTIQSAIYDKARPDDIACPGHVFPAVLDDGAGHPASILYRNMAPRVVPLLWMPLLSDHDGSVVNDHVADYAADRGIPHIRL